MAEKTVRVPEFLKEPLEAAQARLEVLEEETQRVLKDLVQKGKAGRREVGEIFEKLTKQDWNIEELKSRLAKFRTQGLELASEWRDRARTEALERMLELQARAIAFLGVATREQVEDLSKELDRLAKRLEKGKKARKTSRKAQGN